MGRRALRKLSPELDLSGHYRVAEELPEGQRLGELFAISRELEVEVGSGKGLFLENASQGDSDRNFVGIEIAGRYARYAAGRLARAGRDNALMIHGDALPLFRDHLASDSVAAVHVYFPDPWWKKRHHKRRVMSEAFVRDIQRVLQPDGALHFWTDVREYFELSCEVLAEHTQLIGPLEVEQRDAEHSLDYQTHFERRTRLHGEPVYRSRFEKRER